MRLLLIFLLFPVLLWGQADSTFTWLDAKKVNGGTWHVFLLEDNWKYNKFTDANMVMPGYNDSLWTEVNASLYESELPARHDDLFNGVICFRNHIIVDSSLTNEPVAFRITHFGASEIWLDGKLLMKYGRIALDSFQAFDPEYLPMAVQFNKAGPM